MEIESLVPMVNVQDIPRSIAFYRRLGFVVGNTHAPEGSETPVWAWLRCGKAQLMLALAEEPVVAAAQPAVMFYVYCEDVAAFRQELLAAGVEAGEIRHPFYNPRGEFRVTDPDGYVLMITHT